MWRMSLLNQASVRLNTTELKDETRKDKTLDKLSVRATSHLEWWICLPEQKCDHYQCSFCSRKTTWHYHCSEVLCCMHSTIERKLASDIFTEREYAVLIQCARIKPSLSTVNKWNINSSWIWRIDSSPVSELGKARISTSSWFTRADVSKWWNSQVQVIIQHPVSLGDCRTGFQPQK